MAAPTYLLCQTLHVLGDDRIARWVVEHREAPRVVESDEVGFPREEVDEEGLEAGALLAGAGEVVDLAAERGVKQTGPHEEVAAVAAHLEVGEEALDGKGLGGEDVDGVHLGVGIAAVFDALDSYGGRGGVSSSGWREAGGAVGGLTGDVVVEDVIFFDSIVDDLLGAGVDDQAFPLQGC